MKKWINQNTDNGFKLIFRLHFINKLFVYKLPRYKIDLALNNLQGLICYKTHPNNQPKPTVTRCNIYCGTLNNLTGYLREFLIAKLYSIQSL